MSCPYPDPLLALVHIQQLVPSTGCTGPFKSTHAQKRTQAGTIAVRAAAPVSTLNHFPQSGSGPGAETTRADMVALR
jgi:hypothetical protein